MILHAFAIYDRKALTYHAPFFANADGAAVRSFSDLANDSNTTVGRHPGDYVLFRVGAYDDSAGGLLPANPIEHVADAAALVRARPGDSAQHTIDEYLSKTGQQPAAPNGPLATGR